MRRVQGTRPIFWIPAFAGMTSILARVGYKAHGYYLIHYPINSVLPNWTYFSLPPPPARCAIQHAPDLRPRQRGTTYGIHYPPSTIHTVRHAPWTV